MTAPRPRLPRRYSKPTLIAHGGMGDVYRATDESLGRTVAVKVLSERYSTDDEFHARFLREARTAASLSGEPYVIAIHDVAESDAGLPFIVMEYASRGTVADQLREGAVAPGQALEWLEQTAEALDRAHARGIVHRDVKPANLLLAGDGSLRVSDFGIARAADHDTLTAPGAVLGSPGYMAPEQIRGEPSSPATDRYALACVAFELLTGRRPFERDGPAAEAAAHATEPPPSVAGHEGLPPELDAVFARGLAKAPAERHGSANELVANLRQAFAGPPTVIATSPADVALPAPAPATITRHAAPPRRSAVLVAAATLIAAGGLLGWLLSRSGDGSDALAKLTPRTVERTVTVDPETTATTPTTGASGRELNDRGFRLLQQGNARAALPLLESAVSKLRGSGSLTEAYASYNLAWARFTLGRCDGVAALLDRSEALQGERTEIERLRAEVEDRCAGTRGRGKAKGKDKGKGGEGESD